MVSATDILIQKLYQVIDLLKKNKKEEELSEQDFDSLKLAIKYFGEKYFFHDYQSLLSSKFTIGDVDKLINDLKKEGQEEQKPKEQEASIPPELETLKAEYDKHLKELAEAEVNHEKSQNKLASDIARAIAHRKNLDHALANRKQREANGEKFKDFNYLLVSYGDPKSESEKTALSKSYYIAKKVAFTYKGFSALPAQVQNKIISDAVELNLIGVSDINTAIQAASLQVDISGLNTDEKNGLASIPGGFVSTIYQEKIAEDKTATEYEAKMSVNDGSILFLQKQGKLDEAQKLIEENKHLLASLEGQSARFNDLVNSQTQAFQDFEKNREAKYKQIEEEDRDFRDTMAKAKGKISTIHQGLEKNGVKGHIYSPTDEAYLLEQAIMHDRPDLLKGNAGYDAEYAAALSTQDPNLSPQAILLFGKNLSSQAMSEIYQLALDNPDSKLGKLLQTRPDIFSSVSSQIRKISQSKLGQELSKPQTGLGKFFSTVSNKLGRAGKIFNVVSDPYGALRSWAGRKAGQMLLKQIGKYVSNETAQLLLKNGLKEGLKKLIAKAAAKAAVKFAAKEGTKLALKGTLVAAAQALNAIPGLGIVVGFLIGVVIDVAWWIGEKTIGVIKNLQKSVFGSKVKARDYIAVPMAGFAGAIGGITSFLSALGSATAAAAGSAVGIISAGTLLAFFFYITSIAVAPLISTLVNLESTPHSGKANSCANIDDIFISQRDPLWSNVLCPTCIAGDKCNIGGSGCGSASTTMILNSYGIDEEIVSVWNTMHEDGAYFYYPTSAAGIPIRPIQSCPSSVVGNLKVFSDNGLSWTEINLDEAEDVLNNCGLIFSLGQLYDDCPNTETGCGHFLVITGRDGNLITTHDPWSGENYVHNIDGHDNDTFTITSLWAIVP